MTQGQPLKVVEVLYFQPATKPYEQSSAVGYRGVDAILVGQFFIEVIKGEEVFLIPHANVRHVRV